MPFLVSYLIGVGLVVYGALSISVPVGFIAGGLAVLMTTSALARGQQEADEE